jgi:hypothetical protein
MTDVFEVGCAGSLDEVGEYAHIDGAAGSRYSPNRLVREVARLEI